MWRRIAAPLLALTALTLLVAACDGGTPPASTPTATSPTAASATPSPAPPSSTPATSMPTGTPTPRPTVVAPPVATTAPTTVPAATPVATSTAAPAASGTPAPTGTPGATGTATGTPTGTPTPGGSPVPSPTGTPEAVAHVIASLGIPIRLATGVVADLPSGRTLELVDVTGDSRCPADVQCVWAGEATVLLEWATPGDTRRIGVVASPSRGSATTPDGMTLRVLELTPVARSGTTIARADYVATVVVERTGEPSSGSYGSVTVGPACAVQREGVPCPDRPLSATLVFRNVAGGEAARTLSDAAGFYAVAVPGGRYTIVPFTPGGATLPRGIPRDVEVPAGDWVRADVTYDSGIR